jgi:hypothetical protein
MWHDRRIRLLSTQTFLLGILAGFLVIPANGLFLHTYGSKNLPWTYIAIAGFGVACTFSQIAALRRWRIATVASIFFLGLGTAVFCSWLELQTIGKPWVSAPLIVLFPVSFQVGFVLIGGQAGKVFNLGEMKASFGKVVAGFPLGFIVAGLVASVAIPALHGSKHLLLFCAAACFGLAAVFLKTAQAFPLLQKSPPMRTANITQTHTPQFAGPSSTSVTSTVSGPPKGHPVRAILSSRFVRRLLGYQTAVFAQSQLVEFLIFERAAQRYDNVNELASFVSRFQAVMNTATLLFVLSVAGLLFRRFGMQYGTRIAPAIVTTLLICALIMSHRSGYGSLAVFTLIGTTRIASIVFTNGATRASLNTALQALPNNDRLSAQAFIEGVGVPIATGLVGIVLLVSANTFRLTTSGFILLAAAVGLLTLFASRLTLISYAQSLRTGLTQRLLHPTKLNLDDPHTLGVVEEYLSSDDSSLLELGIASTDAHPVLVEHLVRIASSKYGLVAGEALQRLDDLSPQRAELLARDLTSGFPPQSFDPTSRFPDAKQVIAAGILSAQMIDHTSIIETGLTNPDTEQRAFAYRAAVRSTHPHLVKHVVDAIGDSITTATATAALRHGQIQFHGQHRPQDQHQPGAQTQDRAANARAFTAGTSTQFFETAIKSQTQGTFGGSGSTVRLVKALAYDSSWEATLLLVEQLQHRSSEVAAAALQTLARRDPQSLVSCKTPVDELFKTEATHALPDTEREGLLRRSLHDELHLIGRKTLSCLAILFDRDTVEAIAREFAQDDERLRSHAIETLEMSFKSPRHHGSKHLDASRAAVPILSAHRPVSERANMLRKCIPVPVKLLTVRDLAYDDDRQWRRPWLCVCAADYLSTSGLSAT